MKLAPHAHLTRIRWAGSIGMAVLLGCLASPLLRAQTVGPAPEIYTCTDASGRKLTSDRPIPDCADREQKILNPSGTVKARVAPRRSELEQSQLDAQRKAARAEQTRLDEEKKRDRALLIRYPTPELHQKERESQLAHIETVKQTAFGKRQELQAERNWIDKEMSFYEKNPAKAPAKLRQKIDELTRSEAALQRFLNEQDQEIKRTNDRFDEEQRRLTPLWRQATATP